MLALGFRTLDLRRVPDNQPEARIKELAPQLRDIAVGTTSAKPLIDWLEHPSRRDYLLIQDLQSGETYVVDWYGTPYFYRVAGRSGRALTDRHGRRLEGSLSLQAIEQLQDLERLGGPPTAKVTLMSLGPDFFPNSPDDVKLTLSFDQQASEDGARKSE